MLELRRELAERLATRGIRVGKNIEAVINRSARGRRPALAMTTAERILREESRKFTPGREVKGESAMKLIFALVVVLMVTPSMANGAPVAYTVTLTPDLVACPAGGLLGGLGPCTGPPGFGGFDPRPTVGQPYVGSFTLENADILSLSGINIPAPLTAFHLELGGLVWDPFNPTPTNLFVSFRGPRPGNPDCPGGTTKFCLGAPSPGFDVQGGQITQIFGGVFGAADFPLIDFEIGAQGFNRFQAGDGGTFVYGTVLIAQIVPWSMSLLLFSIGLILAIFAQSRVAQNLRAQLRLAPERAARGARHWP